MAKIKPSEVETDAEKEAADKLLAEKEAADKLLADKALAEKASAAVTIPDGFVLMQAPEGSNGITVEGEEYKASETGCVLLPHNAVEVAKCHGFKVQG